jgi:hypothetical protein
MQLNKFLMSNNIQLNINTDTEYQIGDKVKATGCARYLLSTDTKVPIGTVGSVIKIRHRYVGSPNEYKQYKVSFPGYPDGDDVTNMYSSYDLEKYQ